VADNFDGTETAGRKKYLEQVDLKIEFELIDVQSLCSSGCFCDRKEGI